MTAISRTSVRAALLSVLIVAVAFVGFGAGSRSSQRDEVQPQLTVPSASQIISWQDGVGMLDTTNGAIYQLHGNLDNASSDFTWFQRVAPVDGPTSGMLEIQRATFNDPGAIFLVDVLNGDTWVLRNNASTNGRWQRIKIFR